MCAGLEETSVDDTVEVVVATGSMQLSTVTIDDWQSDANIEMAFVAAIANVSGISSDYVRVMRVAVARRSRYLLAGIAVDFDVNVPLEGATSVDGVLESLKVMGNNPSVFTNPFNVASGSIQIEERDVVAGAATAANESSTFTVPAGQWHFQRLTV